MTRTCPWCKAEQSEVLTSSPPRCPTCTGQLGPRDVHTFPWLPPTPEETRRVLGKSLIAKDNKFIAFLREREQQRREGRR